jgi:hypothetical protein
VECVCVHVWEGGGPAVVRLLLLLKRTYMCRRGQKSWSRVSWRPEARNDCAGSGQQELKTLTNWTGSHSEVRVGG